MTLLNSLVRPERPMLGNYKRLLRAAIQALLQRACRLRHIDEAPRLADIRLPGSTRRLSKPEPLRIEEVRALLSAAKNSGEGCWSLHRHSGTEMSYPAA